MLACVCCLAATLTSTALRGLSPRRGVIPGGAEKTVEVRRSIPSAGVALALPTSLGPGEVKTDAYGGNWWYERGGDHPLRLLIAASRGDGLQREIDGAHLRQVLEIVARGQGGWGVSVGATRQAKVSGYRGQRASYEATAISGQEHAVALLLSREQDEVLVIVSGSAGDQAEIDRMADEIFASLRVEPTPASYVLQSV